MRGAGGESRFWVTCYTDASFTPVAAGWAVWLRSARGRIVRHGACPPYVKGSNEAELAAIFAGIYLARRAWGAAVRGLVVYTDSQAAVRFLSEEALRSRALRRSPAIARLRERILTFSKEHGIELELRWIKGHQRTNTVRAYLNARCDELAGKARAATAKSGRQAVVEEQGRAPSVDTAKREGAPSAVATDAPKAEAPRRSKKQKGRERRKRARAKKRAKKALERAACQASSPGCQR